MGETARDEGTPPLVQAQPGRRPRPPLSAPRSSSSAVPSSMPQRSRPQLVRRVNTSQGSTFGGPDQTNASKGGLRGRTNSDGISQRGLWSEQIQGAYAPPPVTTDIRLLLASLDKQAVEDEAETVSECPKYIHPCSYVRIARTIIIQTVSPCADTSGCA